MAHQSCVAIEEMLLQLESLGVDDAWRGDWREAGRASVTANNSATSWCRKNMHMRRSAAFGSLPRPPGSDPLFFFNEGSSAGGGSAARRAGGGDLFRKRDDWKGKLVKQACKKARHNDGLPVSLSVCCLPPSASIYLSIQALACR